MDTVNDAFDPMADVDMMGGDSDMDMNMEGGKAAKKKQSYVVDGVKYKMRYGSRRQVYNGTAYTTTGNLRKGDIAMNKQGRFVSAKKSDMAKKEQRLLRYGYSAKPGKFGYVRVAPAKSLRKTAKKVIRKPTPYKAVDVSARKEATQQKLEEKLAGKRKPKTKRKKSSRGKKNTRRR
tara:strand:+ start:53 stop:583 length:531 start_codon:yes stop_codon:yes gene_type:complete